jgi:hypothetical protein
MKILTIDVGLTKHAVHHFIWDNRLVKIDVITQEIVSQIPGGAQSMIFAIKDGAAFPATAC